MDTPTATLDLDPLLTTDQVAAYFQVERHKLDEFVQAGLERVVLGTRTIRYRRSAVEAFVNNHRTVALPAHTGPRRRRRKVA